MWLQTRRALRHKAIAQNDRASFHRAETIAVGPHASKPMQVRPRQAAHYLIAPTSDAVAVPFVRVSVQHRASPAKAALNDCPHERKAKGALLAAFVGCNPLLYGPLISCDRFCKYKGDR